MIVWGLIALAVVFAAYGLYAAWMRLDPPHVQGILNPKEQQKPEE